MAVELDGRVRLRGESGTGVPVRVVAGAGRLKLVKDNELVGDWEVATIGITSLNEGFVIKAEGEELRLTTSDDVALVDELGLATAAPRIARMVAARHNPEDPPVEPEPPVLPSNLAPVGYALAGGLVVLGGTFLRGARLTPAASAGLAQAPGTSDFWLAFVISGVLMIAVAYIMSIGTSVVRYAAMAVLLAVIVMFGISASRTVSGAGELTAYGFISGGVVVAIAVLFAGSLRGED